MDKWKCIFVRWKTSIKSVSRLWMWKTVLVGEGLLLGLDLLCYGDLLWLLPLQVLLFPYMKAMYRRQKMQTRQRFQKCFRDLLQSMMTSLQAGYSLDNACRTAVRDQRSAQKKGDSLCRMLARLEQGMDLHIPVDRLFCQLAREADSEDCYQFSVVLEIIRSNGGNTVEILRNTIDHLERKLAAEEEIRVLLSGRIFEKNMPQSLFLWDLGFRTTSARLKSKSLRKK